MFPILVVGVVLFFQVFVTWQLWRSDVYLRSEKSSQTQLIWALPLLGAVFVAVMLWDEYKHNKQNGGSGA